MALTDAARNKKLIEVYKKYGRKAPISLVKPVGKKGGGKMAGGKMKSKGYAGGGKVKENSKLTVGLARELRKQGLSNQEIKNLMGSRIKDPNQLFKDIKGKKKGGKVDNDKIMEKILKGMSAKERKLFLESMGFATKDAEGVLRSYRKAGGKMKSKGYKAGGKMKSKGYAGGGKVKAEVPSEAKKKTSPKTTQKKKTTKPDLLGDLILGSGYRMGQMPGNTFKAGGKIKSKGYKAGGKMKSKGYKAGGKMKKKPQSGHNRLY